MAIFKLRELTIFVVFIICFLSVVNCGNKGDIVRITDENWPIVLEGEWLLEFYAPWCPACKSLAPTWDAVSAWSADLDIKVAAVDVTEEAGLSGRFMVTSLPSIYHVIDGEFRRYMGPRTENDIVTFIEDRKFQDVEMIPSWRAPSSISMGLVSFIFKVSMKVRIFHTILTEEYGFPWWSTYGFIGVATVLMGLTLGMVFHNVMTEKYGFPVWVTYGFLAIFTVAFGLFLGLILVFLTDCCCPQKPLRSIPADRRPVAEIIPEEDIKEDTQAEGGTKEEEEQEEVVEKAGGEDETAESSVRQRKTGNEEAEEEAQ